MCDILLLWWVGKLCIDFWHNRTRMRSSSVAIETHELLSWVCSPTLGLVNVPNMVPEPGKVIAVSGWTSGEHGGALWPVVHAAPVCTGLSVVEVWPRLRELGTAWAWQCTHVFDCVGADGGAYWLWYFPERTSVIMGIVYVRGVGVWSPCVCIFHIIITDVGTWSWQRAAALSEWAWQWAHVLDSMGADGAPKWTDFGVFPRGPPSLWVSYTSGVGACEAPVCVLSILFSRTLVHRADSVQQLSVSGRGSGPTCLAVCELNDFGAFPRGPPSLWVWYTFGFGVCESPVCIFSILSRTWVHGANDVQLSVSGRDRLLVHVGLVTVTGTTVSSSYPNNNLTMASELERKRTACNGWATRSANSLKDYLQRDDITKVKLGELISDFDKRLEALDCVQTQVEMSFEDLDALLADIEVSGNYRDSICETRLKALECFEKLSVTNPLEADVTSVTSTGTADVKLPKLSLPKFSGDVLQWQIFGISLPRSLIPLTFLIYPNFPICVRYWKERPSSPSRVYP